jgi:hypothetical protein
VVSRYGLAERCASVRATSLAVLDIERDPDSAERQITAEAARVIADDGAEAICLGRAPRSSPATSTSCAHSARSPQATILPGFEGRSDDVPQPSND